MGDRFNTIAGWVLAALIAAVGFTLLSGEYFKAEPVEKGGYPVASADPSGGGAAVATPIDWTKADVAVGEQTFKQCAACHSIVAGGANGTGPALHGVVGRAKGGVAGFAYSDGLKAMGGTWTFEDLDKWLHSPRKYVTGTKMTYAGIPDNDKRASVIAYLNSQGPNLPLPANAPAAAAPAEAAPAAAGATPAAPAATPAK